MSMSESRSSGGSVTLDQLIALSDEMAALVRAGVPLERGLIEAGREIRGRLGEIANDLGTRLSQGERLPEALVQSDRAMPDVYRAVVEAGVRSGRLSQALEGMAAIARNYADARRAVGLAMLYPLIVLALAYALALLFILLIAPRFVTAFETLGLPLLEASDAPHLSRQLRLVLGADPGDPPWPVGVTMGLVRSIGGARRGRAQSDLQ